MLRRKLAVTVFVSFGLAACGEDEGTLPGPDAGVEDLGPSDLGGPPDLGSSDAGAAIDGGFSPPVFGEWVMYEPEGATCADGSPYRYFVEFSATSDDVVVFFEGGGACWDYASCTGTGVRSAANRDGIPPEHASRYTDFLGQGVSVNQVFPLLAREVEVSPVSDWNKIFVPYCTGDVFAGNRVVTYTDPGGEASDLVFHHTGHQNILSMLPRLREMFPSIPRMLVSGCSAGGSGAINNYSTLREALAPDRGYLLNDSGPIFPDTSSTSRSRPLHDRVREAWGLDATINGIDGAADILTDFGNINTILARNYPGDRFASTFFQLDYNYALYSYERFYEVAPDGQVRVFGDGEGTSGLGLDESRAEDRSAVYGLWADDTALLRAQFDQADNLSYFLPFYRETNDSHCLLVPGVNDVPPEQLFELITNAFEEVAWAGTDMAGADGAVNVRGFVDRFLDISMPLQSYHEAESEGRFAPCVPGRPEFDAAACEAAVAGN